MKAFFFFFENHHRKFLFVRSSFILKLWYQIYELFTDGIWKSFKTLTTLPKVAFTMSFFLSFFFFTFLFFNLNPLFTIAFYYVFWSKPAAIIWAAFHTLQWALDLLRAPAAQWLLSRHHEVQDWAQAFSKSLCCFSGSSSCLLAEGLRSTDRQKNFIRILLIYFF